MRGSGKVIGLSFGHVNILVALPVPALWIPLRQRPGFGAIANVVVVGLAAGSARTRATA